MAEFTLATGRLQGGSSGRGLSSSSIPISAASAGTGQLNIPAGAGAVQYTPTKIPQTVENQVLPSMVDFGQTLMQATLRYQEREAEFLATKAANEYSTHIDKFYNGFTDENGIYHEGYKSTKMAQARTSYSTFQRLLDESFEESLGALEPRVQQRALFKMQSAKSKALSKATNHRYDEYEKEKAFEKYVEGQLIIKNIADNPDEMHKVDPSTGMTPIQEYVGTFDDPAKGWESWYSQFQQIGELQYLNEANKPYSNEEERLQNIEAGANAAIEFYAKFGSEVASSPKHASAMISNVNKFSSEATRSANQSYDLRLKRQRQEREERYRIGGSKVFQLRTEGFKFPEQWIAQEESLGNISTALANTLREEFHGTKAIQEQTEIKYDLALEIGADVEQEEVINDLVENRLTPSARRAFRDNQAKAKTAESKNLQRQFLRDEYLNEGTDAWTDERIEDAAIAGHFDTDFLESILIKRYGPNAKISDGRRRMYKSVSDGKPWGRNKLDLEVSKGNILPKDANAFYDLHFNKGLYKFTRKSWVARTLDNNPPSASEIKYAIANNKIPPEEGMEWHKKYWGDEATYTKSERQYVVDMASGKRWSQTKIQKAVSNNEMDPKFGAAQLSELFNVKRDQAEKLLLADAIDGQLESRQEVSSALRNFEIGTTVATTALTTQYGTSKLPPDRDLYINLLDAIYANSRTGFKGEVDPLTGVSKDLRFEHLRPKYAKLGLTLLSQAKDYELALQNPDTDNKITRLKNFLKEMSDLPSWQENKYGSEVRVNLRIAEEIGRNMILSPGEQSFTEIIQIIGEQYNPARQTLNRMKSQGPLEGGIPYPENGIEATNALEQIMKMEFKDSLTERKMKAKAKKYVNQYIALKQWKDRLAQLPEVSD